MMMMTMTIVLLLPFLVLVLPLLLPLCVGTRDERKIQCAIPKYGRAVVVSLCVCFTHLLLLYRNIEEAFVVGNTFGDKTAHSEVLKTLIWYFNLQEGSVFKLPLVFPYITRPAVNGVVAGAGLFRRVSNFDLPRRGIWFYCCSSAEGAFA